MTPPLRPTLAERLAALSDKSLALRLSTSRMLFSYASTPEYREKYLGQIETFLAEMKRRGIPEEV